MRVLYFNECLFVAVIFLFHIFSQCLIFTFNSKGETSMKYFLLYLQHQFISKSQFMIVSSKILYCYFILKFLLLFNKNHDPLFNDSMYIIFYTNLQCYNLLFVIGHKSMIFVVWIMLSRL